MSEYRWRNMRTETEYENLGYALDEAEDQNDIESINDGKELNYLGEEDE